MPEFKNYTKINGLSETRRMPRLGKIRLGAKVEKKTGEKSVEYPVELPFFLLPDEVGAVHGGATAERAKELGVTRKDVLDFIAENSTRLAEQLEVIIPVEEIDKSFPQAYKMYGSSAGLKCIGDGQTAQRRTEANDWQDISCPCGNLKTDANPKGECTRMAHLQVMLPGVSAGGVYQIDIGSINSIIDINSGIEYVRALFGRVAMVPLILKRVATETHFEGKKQTHWTCQLVANYNLEKVNMIRNDTEKIFSHYQIEAPEYIDPKSTPPDVVIVQPEEVKKMIDELRKLAENKKLKKYEIDAIAAASRDNNDDELLRIYNQIKAREKGKSADDLVEKLT